MAYGFGGPCDERLAQAGGTLPVPMAPRFVPAAFRDWRDPCGLLECLRGGIAVPLFPAGDEEAGGKDGASAWQSGKAREIRMALGTLCQGRVEGCNGLQKHAALRNE